MKIELEPTGERVIEDAYHRSPGAYVIYVMHAASYAFAERYCEGRRTLDLGCGSGYGSFRIAGVASSVIGVDVAEDAVDFARGRYVRPNLSFMAVEPGRRLPFDDESFDVVLSFQVIEHVHDVRSYLEEARRILRPGGVMVIITPDRKHRLLPWQRPWNRWHLREYSVAGLVREVSPVFGLDAVLRMGAAASIARLELNRYRWTKWATLPMTLPFIPDCLRRWALDRVHQMKGHGASVDAAEPVGERTEFGFDETAIEISEDAPNPLNIVLVARKRAEGLA